MTTEVYARAEVSVGGMTCASCAERIKGAIDGLDGIFNSRVDLITERAIVSYDPERLGAGEIHDAICSAGYSTSGPTPPETHAGETTRRFNLQTLHLSAVLAAAAAAMLISSISALRFEGWGWLVGALTTPVVLISGREFHRKGWAGLLRRHPSMDSLVSLGTLTAWGWSAVIVAGGFDGHLYFDTAAVITAVLLLGRRLEGGAKRRAGEAIAALARLESDSVRLENGEDIPADELGVGMRFLVRPGERIAADGVVVGGCSAVDASAMTGESTPVEAAPGSEVLGGTLNVSGSLVVKATRVGSETALAHIKQLTEDALSRRAPIERHAERITTVFVPAVLAIAAVTLGVSLALRSADAALSATVAVLIAACPCALGLAIPAAFVAGSGRGARMGVIIRGPDALESARKVDVVALDKTGTVTEGRLEAVAVETTEGVDSAELLALAAALESRSEHPAAKAVVKAAQSASSEGGDGLENWDVVDFENLPGLGVRGSLKRAAKKETEDSATEDSADNHSEYCTDAIDVAVGKPGVFEFVGDLVSKWAHDHAAAGRTVVLVGRGGEAEGLIALAEGIRPGAAAAVKAWHGMGAEVMVLSGDGQEAARKAGREVGADRTIGELSPGDKAAWVGRLQAEERCVAMVGDGINDAPALAAADLGVAMGSGADVAQSASDLTLVSEDLRAAVDAMALARATLRTIKVNLFWAFAYNTAIIPVAALGLLMPEIAAAAMGFSSLFVLGNSLRLTRFSSMFDDEATKQVGDGEASGGLRE